MASRAAQRRTVSVLGIAPYVELAAARGIAAARLLRGTGVAPAVLADPTARVSATQERALVVRLRALVPEPTLGLRVGLAFRLGAFGLLGSAVSVAPTPREAVRLFLQYVHLTYTPFDIGLIVDGPRLRVCFTDRTDLGALRRFYLERDLACAVAIGRALPAAGGQARPVAVAFDHPAPAEARAYAAVLGCKVEFDAPLASVLFELAPEATGGVGSALALGVLEEHLRWADGAGGDGGLAARVRGQVARALAADWRVPAIEGVARDLGCHPRTLRRWLTAEGTSYRALVDGILLARARRLLADPALRLADVAARLGFAEPASFIHAHRRWTGRTPRGRR